MLGDAAVMGQVKGRPILFLAVLADPVPMLQVRRELLGARPCVAPGAHFQGESP